MTTPPTPRPLKVSLITAPQYPIETLWYIWMQSRSNTDVPSPVLLDEIINCDDPTCEDCAEILKPYTPLSPGEFRDMFETTVQMILHESIPVTENLFFVFHLQNIPISLREQLVRHRIGTKLDMRVGADIVPIDDLPVGSLMEIHTLPDLADSTWWSQTSRVINQGAFYDEGRFLLPESLQGKTVTVPGEDRDGHTTSETIDAGDLYLDTLYTIQHAYNKLVEAGVHIEDARQLIPVGATHGITWGLNLKAMMHIFGKRTSWISQVGIWGELVAGMVEELCKKVSPLFRVVSQPACIKHGKYVGCPVNGTNVERVQGTDGMPPCPLWVRYQTQDAIAAADSCYDPCQGLVPTWMPPGAPGPNREEEIAEHRDWGNIQEWHCSDPVQREMLDRTAAKFSKLWQLDVFDPKLEEAR